LLEERQGILKRYLLGGLLIVAAAISATAVAAFHEVDKIVNALHQNATLQLNQYLAQADTGKPQTILIIGSDKRQVGATDFVGGPGRSDTMMLVRLDPSKKATALLSLPRDLKVKIPGHGVAKLNEAYADGGVKLTLRTIKQLTGLRINHVVNVDFRGFRKVIDQLGCVYIDVDRHYYNQGGGYAKIDIPAGYQRLCGPDGLDYVRYRHDDNDIIRAARQQGFIRELKSQVGIGKLIDQRDKLIEIFGRYTQSDIGSQTAVVRLLNLVAASATHPLHEIHFTANLGPSFVTASSSEVHRVAQEFLGLNQPSTSAGPRSKKGKKHGKRTSRPNGLIDSSASGKQQALQLVSAGVRGMRIFYPRRITGGSMFVSQPRAYRIFTQHRHYSSYRLVLATGKIGEYYGLEGTRWKNPPILHSPSSTKKMGGRKYMIFTDGSRIRLIAWQTATGTYWISNTLSETLSKSQMLGIARSAKPL